MVTLGTRRRLSRAFEPPIMRLTDDASRSVVFLGHVQDPADESTFVASATGFFLSFKGICYLITAAHVASALGDLPFQARLNRVAGGAGMAHVDCFADPNDKWFLHPDPSVDVAAMAFPVGFAEGGWDHKSIRSAIAVSDEDIENLDIGPGDEAYAVGLFRLMQGSKRSVPVVHRGSIAAMPSDDLIPVNDQNGKRFEASVYLVEATNLNGLSGSPVFVRSTISVVASRAMLETDGRPRSELFGAPAIVAAVNQDVRLLGVWSGSFEARSGEALSLDQGKEVRVPVGVGLVVPVARVIELLDTEPVKRQRDQLFEQFSRPSAVADATG